MAEPGIMSVATVELFIHWTQQDENQDGGNSGDDYTDYEGHIINVIFTTTRLRR